MKVHREKDETHAKKKAAEAINGLLASYKERPILLMLAGGSALGLLDYIDFAKIRGRERADRGVTLTVTDERYSKDPAVNTFAQIIQTEFYRKAKESGAQCIDTRVSEGENFEYFADRFAIAIEEWEAAWGGEPDRFFFGKGVGGRIVIIQGVGEDGHTAGIMPYPENPELFKKLFEDSKRWVVGYDAGEKNPHPLRVTLTLPFLRKQVHHSIVYVVGENKREVLERVLAEAGALWETPARIIHEMKNVELFTNL